MGVVFGLLDRPLCKEEASFPGQWDEPWPTDFRLSHFLVWSEGEDMEAIYPCCR